MNPATQPITTAGGGAASAASPGAPRHAYVENGAIRLLQFGCVETVSRWDAVCALSSIDGSDDPATQERARQIRAALKETLQ